MLSRCLYNLYAKYILRNAGLEEAQAGIKFTIRNINNLWYEDDTTLMAESEEELKSLLMKVKEESEKVVLKLNIQKPKIMESGAITPWQIDGGRVEILADFILGGSKITAGGDCNHEIKRCLLLGRKVMTNSVQFSSVQSLSHVWPFVTPWIEHARPPCPSQTPRVYPNTCPSSRWCHPAISSWGNTWGETMY